LLLNTLTRLMLPQKEPTELWTLFCLSGFVRPRYKKHILQTVFQGARLRAGNFLKLGAAVSGCIGVYRLLFLLPYVTNLTLF